MSFVKVILSWEVIIIGPRLSLFYYMQTFVPAPFYYHWSVFNIFFTHLCTWLGQHLNHID